MLHHTRNACLGDQEYLERYNIGTNTKKISTDNLTGGKDRTKATTVMGITRREIKPSFTFFGNYYLISEGCKMI